MDSAAFERILIIIIEAVIGSGVLAAGIKSKFSGKKARNKQSLIEDINEKINILVCEKSTIKAKLYASEDNKEIKAFLKRIENIDEEVKTLREQKRKIRKEEE